MDRISLVKEKGGKAYDIKGWLLFKVLMLSLYPVINN